MKSFRVAGTIFVVLVLLDLVILISGRRVLVSEKLVRAGEVYTDSDGERVRGDVNGDYVCRYFTGRNVITHVDYEHDQCPFVVLAE